MGISVFLPRSSDVDAITPEEMCKVYDICMDELRNKCNVILFIYPFGFSVSAKLGAAAMLKYEGMDKTILYLDLSSEGITIPEKEGMMYPALDRVFRSTDEVISYISHLEK